jgi:hypothetical protein
MAMTALMRPARMPNVRKIFGILKDVWLKMLPQVSEIEKGIHHPKV